MNSMQFLVLLCGAMWPAVALQSAMKRVNDDDDPRERLGPGQVTPDPTGVCMGGWIAGDAPGIEQKTSSASSKEDCVDIVKANCPGANGATYFPGKGCWCNFDDCGTSYTSGGYDNAMTCHFFDQTVDEPPDEDCCIGGWKPGDARAIEFKLGVKGSQAECLAAVRSEHGDMANGATFHQPSGKCFGEINQSTTLGHDLGSDPGSDYVNCRFGYWCGYSLEQQTKRQETQCAAVTPPTPAPPCDITTGTCSVSEDPHVNVFDGAEVSLLQDYTETNDMQEHGDKWLVKSSLISIQAQYRGDDQLPARSVFARAVAVGGAFLKGNVIVIGSLEDQITWNGGAILEEQSSMFEAGDADFFVKANRSIHSSLVQDPSKENPGVNVELPLGVSLVVNRLHHHISVTIKMPPQEGGQDGICGNFNGIAVDDALELASERMDPSVSAEESLFAGLTFE